jgi:hypothetical protein
MSVTRLSVILWGDLICIRSRIVKKIQHFVTGSTPFQIFNVPSPFLHRRHIGVTCYGWVGVR